MKRITTGERQANVHKPWRNKRQRDHTRQTILTTSITFRSELDNFYPRDLAHCIKDWDWLVKADTHI